MFLILHVRPQFQPDPGQPADVFSQAVSQPKVDDTPFIEFAPVPTRGPAVTVDDLFG